MKTSDEIKKSLDAHCRPFSCGECEYEKMIFCRDHLMKDTHALIQQLEAQIPKWISVEERLPEEKNRVLIYWVDHIFEATYLWDGNFETLDKQLLLAGRDFTHWTPMLELPKEVAKHD